MISPNSCPFVIARLGAVSPVRSEAAFDAYHQNLLFSAFEKAVVSIMVQFNLESADLLLCLNDLISVFFYH